MLFPGASVRCARGFPVGRRARLAGQRLVRLQAGSVAAIKPEFQGDLGRVCAQHPLVAQACFHHVVHADDAGGASLLDRDVPILDPAVGRCAMHAENPLARKGRMQIGTCATMSARSLQSAMIAFCAITSSLWRCRRATIRRSAWMSQPGALAPERPARSGRRWPSSRPHGPFPQEHHLVCWGG